MARKNLLTIDNNRKNQKEAGGEAPAPSPARRPATGAIGAVSRSLADLKNRAVVEVPADMIDAAGLQDRLDEDAEGLEALMRSIEDYGQQVPVMLRHSPNVEGRYDVIYGRRRVAALKELGLPVKAMVRDMTDRDLVVAQGQENNARKNLSYIEKALFGFKMAELGFPRKIICDALNADKTQVSRMMTIADALPEDLIRAIGAAPSVGRDRWKEFMDAYQRAPSRRKNALEVQGPTSDIRFEFALAGLKKDKPRKKSAAAEVIEADGQTLASVKRAAAGATLMLTYTQDGFDQWLIDRLPDLHRRFKAGEDGPEQ